jgi:hypothetical protein
LQIKNLLKVFIFITEVIFKGGDERELQRMVKQIEGYVAAVREETGHEETSTGGIDWDEINAQTEPVVPLDWKSKEMAKLLDDLDEMESFNPQVKTLHR